MLDMNRERLRHLMVNAILEQWKKETGSQSAVAIEATICITSGNGRTVVIQVADKFTGGSIIPEYDYNYDKRSSSSSSSSRKKRRNDDGSPRHHHHDLPTVDTQPANAAAMAAYLDDLSPASLVSPPADITTSFTTTTSTTTTLDNKCSPLSDRPHQDDSGIGNHDSPFGVTSNRNRSGLSISQIQDNFLSDNEDDVGVDIDVDERTRDSLSNSHNSSATAGPVCGGTGYYTLDGAKPPLAGTHNNNNSYTDRTFDDIKKEEEEDYKRLNNNNNDKDGDEPMHEHESSSRFAETSMSDSFAPRDDVTRTGPLMSTPKCYRKQRSRDEQLRSTDVLDLSSRKEVVEDLALSPPQNYTAQVRDVIRQRLLAQKFSTNQLRFEEQSSGGGHESTDCSKSLSESLMTQWESKDSVQQQLSDSLPTTPVSSMFPPGSSPFLSPETNPLLVFPFPSFTQHRRNLLYAGHIQEMIKRNVPLLPIPPSNTAAVTAAAFSLERPSSEPMNLVQSPTSAPDKMSLSLDGRHTPQSANGDQKVYSCDFCHKTFLFKSKYQEHLPVHTNARPYQCRLCSRTYKYKYDLRVHLRTHLGIPTKSTLCPFCNEKFDTNKLLRHHIKDVHREHHKTLTDEQMQMFDAI